MAAARNAGVAPSGRSLRAGAAGPLDGVTPLAKGTPLPTRRALPANRQHPLKAKEFTAQPTSARPERRRIRDDFRNETTIEEMLALYRELVPNPA